MYQLGVVSSVRFTHRRDEYTLIPKAIGNSSGLERIAHRSSCTMAFDDGSLAHVLNASLLISLADQGLLCDGTRGQHPVRPAVSVDAGTTDHCSDLVSVLDSLAEFLDIDCIDGFATAIAVGGSVKALTDAVWSQDTLVAESHGHSRREDEAGAADKSAVTVSLSDGCACHV
jgi:hypothetical protein